MSATDALCIVPCIGLCVMASWDHDTGRLIVASILVGLAVAEAIMIARRP